MTITRLCWVLACGLFLTGSVAGEQPAGRSEESFDFDWRFERFGPLPDGSTTPEPGGPGGWSITASASSEELDKGNLAQNAFDDDPDSRWCAENANVKQWLALDLGRRMKLGGIEVDWEFPDLTYKYVVEGSNNGKKWKSLADGDTSIGPKRLPLSATARYVRLRTTALPPGKWASIREIRLFGGDKKPIHNSRLKSEAGKSPSDADFDDSAWRTLDVPHDWGIEGPFRDDLPGDTGKLPWRGIGWYRKHFTVPAADGGKRIFIDFDGAMANAKVWLNGQYVGTWPYGYNAFRLELTPFIKFGGENTLAVRLDTVHWGSRWYPGAGIYRNVRIVKTSPVHVGHWGVFVTTPSITDDKGEVKLAVSMDNQSEKAATASVRSDIYELTPAGKAGNRVASTAAAETRIPAQGSARIGLNATVPKPKLWNLDKPNRYLARTVVTVDGYVVDSYDQPFGFRTIEFTPRDGFKLNGRRVPLQGTCNHHDLGALGAALNVRALQRQLEILKEMGCNALRTSHNPPAPELLDLADRLGFLVMVEAFDCWQTGKTANDYSRLFAAWHKRDLQAMVRRERNHPSVIMWSIGNEIYEQNGPKFSKMLGDIVRAEDPTRPVTAGCNDAWAAINGFQTGVDVFGLNYNTGFFPRALNYPGNQKKPMFSSESSSCISSRGEYFFPPKRGRDSEANFQVSSYDVDAPGWAQTPDEEFAALDRSPAFLGEFVWTGFDYLGEPTPYNSDVANLLNFSDPGKRAAMKRELDALGKIKVPSASSYFGIVDLCGFKKDRFYLYQARWRPDLPMAHILPHWNWPERIGKTTPVYVYTSGDEAELFLNGKSLGKKKKKKGRFEYRLRWNDVVYQPGELRVVAYREGKPWANDVVKTSGEPAKLLLQADRAEIRGDGKDLSFVTVTIADKDGRLVPRSNNLVKFDLAGPGEIVAVGNGDAASHEPFQARQRRAFNGLCLVIVRAKTGPRNSITLKAQSDNLTGAEVSITRK
ncbi:MAG: beta-galactosidase GalB [Thermoguttaceae bacterium]